MIGIATIFLSALLAADALPAAPDAGPVPDAAASDDAAAIPPEAAALRKQATDLFRAKKFAEACPLFAKASALATASYEIDADLGLCWEKAGDKDKAIAADLRAAARGLQPIRLHAYFNLAKLGRALEKQMVTKNAKGQDETGCVNWPSDIPGCAATLTACPFGEEGGGSGGTTTYSGIAVCDTQELASRYKMDHDGTSCLSLTTGETDQSFCRAQDYCPDGEDSPGCDERLSECGHNNESASANASASCAVVFVDACHDSLGVVCDGVALELSPDHDFAVSTSDADAPKKAPKKKKAKKK